MRELLTTFGIGLFSGVLSGAFGIGGGIVTTPGIRLLLGAPALVAVGTPLPVIIPSAITGSLNYFRRGSLDPRVGVWCAAFGSVFAVLGALATQFAGGTVVLLATAALIFYTAGDMILQLIWPARVTIPPTDEQAAFTRIEDALPTEESRQGTARPSLAGAKPQLWKLALIGAVTGTYSGFLGLGGGFVLVPMLTRWLGFDIKRAIGTSLMAIAILGIPGTITHALLGHVDWRLAAVLTVGVIPGAWAGSRLTLRSGDRVVRIAFAVMLVLVGSWLALAELGWLAR